MTGQSTELARKSITLAPPKKREGFLVSISGIDGSGKSSNTIALCDSLARMDFPVKRAWTGHKPILSYPIFAIVRLLGYTHRVRFRGLVFFRREILRNRAIATLWPLFIAMDYVLNGIPSVTIPLHRGRIVVSDRYSYDVTAQLVQEAHIGNRTRNVLLNLLRCPDVAFLIDVDESLAWQRAMVPGRAREQPYYDLAERRRIYLELARENGMIVLDGSRDIFYNKRDILEKTLEAINLSRRS